MDEMTARIYGVYVLADEAGRITSVNSDAFLSQTDGWVKIDEGRSDRCHHAQGNYFLGGLMDAGGVYRYKLEGKKAVQRTEDEMAADIPKVSDDAEPSDTELLMEIAADHEYRLCLMEMGVGDMV